MEVTCQNCNAKIQVPDGKVPAGKSFSFNCPSCKGKVTVTAKKEGAASAPAAPAARPAAEGGKAQMLSSSSEAPGAMACHTDTGALKKAFQKLGYQLHLPESHQDANKNVRFNDYKVIVITEEFENIPHDGPSILESLQVMGMEKRRRMFVVYIGSDVKTGDSMGALAKSVNLFISSEDLQKEGEGIADTIARGVYENDLQYKVYFETMKAQGKV